MAENTDYRLYLEEKFNALNTHMNAQFGTVHDKLERIEDQTIKTNGRVTELEKKELSHIINCPQVTKIAKIENDLAEYNFFKKYPRILAGIIIVVVMGFGFVMYETYIKVASNTTQNNKMMDKVDSLNIR